MSLRKRWRDSPQGKTGPDFCYPLPEEMGKTHWERYKWHYTVAVLIVVLVLVVWSIAVGD